MDLQHMEVYMNEKWKLSKKESLATVKDRGLPENRAEASGGRPRSFSRRCSVLFKEHRARFYIMRRCVSMLICWRDCH